LRNAFPAGICKRYKGWIDSPGNLCIIQTKGQNLKIIFKLQNGQRFKQRFAGMSMAELLKAVWDFDICLCPACGHPAMKQLGRCYGHPS